MKTKQQAIQEAYGEHWGIVKNYVDENGWCELNVSQKEPINNFANHGKTEWKPINNRGCWRPKSLQGIENNNGWIKIESEDDLPKEEIDVHFIFENNTGRFQTFGVWDNKIKSFYSGALKISNVTHYQPIEKPKPPIY